MSAPLTPRVYIAGPMTGLPQMNYPAFVEAAARWREAGWDVVAPHENFDGDTTLPYGTYIRADLAMLLTATAIALLPGWEHSRGARFELHAAQLMGFDMYDAVSMDPVSPPRVATDLMLERAA